MKTCPPKARKLRQQLKSKYSPVGSFPFTSFSGNRSTPIIHLGIALAIFSATLLLGIGCTVTVEPGPTYTSDQQASPDVVATDEYQPPPPEVTTIYESDLNPYGSWVPVTGYGQCWVPNNRPPGWQPYTVGYWADTDYGWTWVAVDDESQWGDITYHYGRWYSAPSVGWVWIPGTTWAPAWVAWREGGGYCGWAPLPPQAGFRTQYSTEDTDRYMPANQFVYCDERYVTAGRVDQHIVRNDVTIINNTTNITNITYVNNHVVNQGISPANVSRATGRPVEKTTLATAATPEEARTLAAAGKPVIYAPPKIQQAEKQRVANAATAKNPKSPTPPGHPQPPVEPPHNVEARPGSVNPTNPENKTTNKNEQNQAATDQAAEAAKAKAEQDQAAANAKASADAKAQAAADANAKANAAADAKAKADAEADAKPKPAPDKNAQASGKANAKPDANAKAKAAADAKAKADADAKAKAAAAKNQADKPPGQ